MFGPSMGTPGKPLSAQEHQGRLHKTRQLKHRPYRQSSTPSETGRKRETHVAIKPSKDLLPRAKLAERGAMDMIDRLRGNVPHLPSYEPGTMTEIHLLVVRMKEITQNDIEAVKAELSAKRKEFESLGLTNLDEQLKWIQNFFNSYIPELEKRFMTEKELKEWVFLPNKLRIQFYLFFPEHGLNMANYSQDIAHELADIRKKPQFVDRFYFSHYD